MADGFLLDVLVIDEASQVGLLEAGLALSCCRNLVVVGDLRQLLQFGNDAAEGLEPPRPGYDCRRHNILSSMLELYSDIPRTLLKEHYRCDPAIIGFCNKAFYSGELIPYTAAGAEQPMMLRAHGRRDPVFVSTEAAAAPTSVRSTSSSTRSFRPTARTCPAPTSASPRLTDGRSTRSPTH